jgi:exopolysaccharide biosynthesis polyprenyl glycosylphosphotransferase
MGAVLSEQIDQGRLEASEPLSYQQRYRSSVGSAESTSTSESVRVMSPFRNRLIATDSFMIVLALGVGLLVSSRASAWAIDPTLAIYGTPVVIGLLWLLLLLTRGSYDLRVIGLGSQEVRRAVSATLVLFATVAGLSYLIRADISRAYAFISLPLGILLIGLSRFGWRQWLYRQRASGNFLSKIIVIGSARTSQKLTDKLNQESYAGYEVVDQVTLPAHHDSDAEAELNSWLEGVDQIIRKHSASAIAIDPGDDAPYEVIRQLSWRLEGRNIDLLISPGSLDVAGPRLSVRPAAGLPLLHLDEAVLSRSQRASKRALDVFGSLIAIILLSPLMLLSAISVRLTSRGPVIYKQTRVGRAGKTFTMLKFRTMHNNAEYLINELREQHNLIDPMFKLGNDPRITKVGGFLRRWSLDETPQLFNVLLGSMSLVGPRPHPLDDVDRYQAEAFRRLALKPGMTGLWQVEGRSDLAWDQALQLDLHYVERWSLESDIYLLARTAKAVIGNSGAI